MKTPVRIPFLILCILICSVKLGGAQITSNPDMASIDTLQLKAILKNMILIEGGTFQMGCTPEQGELCSNDEFPVHTVNLNSFYLLSTELTQAWWMAFSENNPSGFSRGGDFPVENVSYKEVIEFIDRMNKMTGLHFRLPTESEWEFAARGGNFNCGFRYSGSNDPNDVSWNNKNAYGKTRVVKLKQPNNLGIYDLSGNVWEWVANPYKLYRIQASGNNAYADHFVIRGGSYAGSPDFCRISVRHHYPIEFKSSYVGFRLAMDADKFPVK